MALKALLDDLVFQTIGTTIDDLKEVITHKSYQGQVYDIDTAAPAISWANQSGVNSALVRFDIKEVDSEVNMVTDLKALIPGKGLLNIPKKTDTIIRANGSIWEIYRVKGVPGNSVWICYIRETY